MRILKALLLTIFTLTFIYTAPAQDSNFTEGELLELGSRLSNGSSYLTAVKRNVKGDPYFNNDLLRGVIQVNENTQTEELFLRYNMADNVLEFARGEQLYIMDPNKIDGFTIFGTPSDLVFRNGFTSDKNDIKSSTFMRIIYDGEVKLAAHHTSNLKENIPTYGSATKTDEYVDDTDFFIIDNSGSFSETKLKRKDILKALDKDYRDELKDYAGENNLSFDNESDLKQILKHYDSLRANS